MSTTDRCNSLSDNEGTDFITAEIERESEYETDIETEDECKEGFDPTGRTRYLKKCDELGVVPVSNFLSNLKNASCDLKHKSLGPKGMQAVARALIQNNYITELLLCDNAIRSEGSVYIAKLLQENINITKIDISENEIGSIGAHNVAQVLQENNSLLSINLSENLFKDIDASVLAQALERNYGLRHLNLSRNKFSQEAGISLGNVIDVNTSLKTLDLSWNHLRGSGAIAIAKGLENNCSLHTLLLAWNGFGDDGACAVAEALLENNTLQELDLSNNRITRKGCFALADALRVNTSLKILRIGKNQLGGDGAHALLSAIQGNEETSIELLDMDGVVIEQQTQPILSKLVKCKPHFDISCVFSKSGGQLGNDLQDVYNRRHKPKKYSAEYTIQILKAYVKSKNLRLLDLFNQFDKDKSQSVSREELKRGFKSIDVPLSDKQLDNFLREMDIDGDGEIDYSEFTWINDAS